MTTKDGNAPLLTVPEAAKVLRIGRNLAYQLVASGELPSLRLGRVIRVPRDALDRWIEVASGHAPVPTGLGELPSAPIKR